MKLWRLFLLMCLFLLPVLFLNACGKSHKKNAGVWNPDGQLVLNIGAEPSVLNPILERDAPSSAVIGLIFNGLLKVNDNLDLVPDLAKSYTVSADGREYIFT